MPTGSGQGVASTGQRDVLAEAARRRSFAIISHPDAGKTTLTEKLLLYAGAIDQAGSVKARRQRRAATSDWMALERERGISVTSAVLRFEFGGVMFNLMDTPGHRDFSEDTLRVLAAADSAVILLDAARGIESQTLKLFHVARELSIPLMTFVNKYDRPALAPLELIDQMKAELGLDPAPVTWPVGAAESFNGVVDRRDGTFHRFERTPRGATVGSEERIDLAQVAADRGEEWAGANEEVALLDAVGANLDREAYLSGASTPVFFGSALSNFGVRLLLEALIDLAPAPTPRPDREGARRDLSEPFSGLVFKVQANLDLNHRDRLAFVRVCSGRFDRGIRVVNGRSGQAVGTNYAHELFGRERQTLEAAYPGDVVGLANAGDVRVGDTLYVGPEVQFPTPPTVTPDRFIQIRSADTRSYKKFRRGLEQLEHEGVVHVLSEPHVGRQRPILAGAGELQFDVACYRLEHEFGASVRREALDLKVSRTVDESGRSVVETWSRGRILIGEGITLAAFRDEFELERFERAHPDVALGEVI